MTHKILLKWNIRRRNEKNKKKKIKKKEETEKELEGVRNTSRRRNKDLNKRNARE